MKAEYPEPSRLSFYVVDDLRLDTECRTINRFLSLQDALARYQLLPEGTAKELGVTDGRSTLRLIRQAALFPGEGVWKNVLITEQISCAPWRSSQAILRIARECASALNIRYCLEHGCLIPKPIAPPHEPRQEILGRLTVRRAYLAGLGWLSIDQLKRRFPDENGVFTFPLVLKYLVNIQTDSCSQPVKLSHWELRQLEFHAANLNHMSLAYTGTMNDYSCVKTKK